MISDSAIVYCNTANDMIDMSISESVSRYSEIDKQIKLTSAEWMDVNFLQLALSGSYQLALFQRPLEIHYFTSRETKLLTP